MADAPTEYNLADLFESVAEAVPERVALVCGQRRLTYAQLEERANRLANHLLGAGIGPGDHVGIQLFNGTEYVECMLAAFKIRAVPININYRYVTAELQHIFRDADIRALVHQRELAPRVAEAIAGLPELRHLIALDDSSGAHPVLGAIDYDQALAKARPRV